MVGTLYGFNRTRGPGTNNSESLSKTKGGSPVIAYPKKRKGSKSYAQQIIDILFSANRKRNAWSCVSDDKGPCASLERKWSNTVEIVWEKLKEGKDVAF